MLKHYQQQQKTVVVAVAAIIGPWFIHVALYQLISSLGSRELIRLPVFGLPKNCILGHPACPNVSVAHVFFPGTGLRTCRVRRAYTHLHIRIQLGVCTVPSLRKCIRHCVHRAYTTKHLGTQENFALVPEYLENRNFAH